MKSASTQCPGRRPITLKEVKTAIIPQKAHFRKKKPIYSRQVSLASFTKTKNLFTGGSNIHGLQEEPRSVYAFRSLDMIRLEQELAEMKVYKRKL